MPVVTMPDGNDVSFPDSMPADQIRNLIASKFPNEVKTAIKPPDTSVSRIVTDIPGEIGSEFMKGATSVFQPRPTGPLEGPLSTLGRLGGVGQMVFSIPMGIYHSVVGHGLSDLERLAGENVINPIVEKLGGKPQHPDPEAMYEQAKADADKALLALGPGRAGVNVAAIPRGGVTTAVEADLAQAQAAREAAIKIRPQPVVEAVERLSEQGVPVNIPRAEATESRLAQQAGQWGSKLPVVGGPVARAVEAVPSELETAASTVAGRVGTGEGPAVAGQVGRDLAEAASTETRTAEQAAEAAHQAELAQWDRTTRQQIADLDAQHQQAETAAQARFGNVEPQDMGEDLIRRVQGYHAQAEARKNALYDAAGNAEGTVASDEVQNVANQVHRDLSARGETPDPKTMPAAAGMLNELDNLARLQIPNAVRGAAVPATGETQIAGVNLQGLEQTRKRLNFLASGATNRADTRAARTVMRAFDDWQANAMQNHLIGGSPEALDTFLRARQANHDWLQNFGYNGNSDAENFINRMATEDVTPQEVVGKLIGDKAGKQGVSSRLHDQVMTATGNDPAAAQSIRGAYWNKLAGTPEGVTARAPEKIASDISEFLGGSGRDMAGRVFSPADQEAARAHADTIRQIRQERGVTEEIAQNTRPTEPGKIAPGPTQQLANRVLGTGQPKSEESLFNTINQYAQTKGGDIKTLASLVQGLSPEAKGGIGSAMIRNLGLNKAKEFSPAQFVTDWNNISPQAKSLLFDAKHRQAIDDITTIAERHRDVFRKFGNPSGSATNLTFTGVVAALTGAATNPLLAMKLIFGAGGGYFTSKLLASPAGASSLSKWSKVADAVSRRPTPQGVAAFRLATRNLQNTAQSLESK